MVFFYKNTLVRRKRRTRPVFLTSTQEYKTECHKEHISRIDNLDKRTKENNHLSPSAENYCNIAREKWLDTGYVKEGKKCKILSFFKE